MFWCLAFGEKAVVGSHVLVAAKPQLLSVPLSHCRDARNLSEGV